MALAQKPQKTFVPSNFDEAYYGQFEVKKRIPPKIRAQTLIALSYFPELKKQRITFRFRKRKTPLTSRPRILSSLLPKGWRSYVITISSHTTSNLEPILFKNLPFNAQIGVLGHEISHVQDYKARSSFQLMGLPFKLGNSDFVDRFEFRTDETTISQGLGHQLLDWSIYVRKALGIKEWHGASEAIEAGNLPTAGQRYMNPATIKAYMKKSTLYQEPDG